MREFIRSVYNIIGDNWLIAFIAITLAIIGGVAKSEQLPTHCLNWASALEQTLEVTVGGSEMNLDGWVVDGDTITVRFASESVQTWNRQSIATDRISALGDWIETALRYEKLSGLPTFAGRDPDDGTVWLINQYRDHTGAWTCIAQPLDPLIGSLAHTNNDRHSLPVTTTHSLALGGFFFSGAGSKTAGNFLRKFPAVLPPIRPTCQLVTHANSIHQNLVFVIK